MSARHAALLVALASIWGASYLLIKYALEDFEPPFIVWGRLLIALAVLPAALAVSGRRSDLQAAARDLRRRPRSAALLGLLAIGLPFMLITVGELHVPSGLTAVLIAPASIFVAMLAPLLDASERADARASAGMGIGLAGVALLVGVESVQSLGEFLGSLAMLGAALSYALGGFVVKRRYSGVSPLATSLVSISASAVLIAPLGLATLPDAMPGWRASLALLALGALGTALAFVIFYNLVAQVGAGRASLVSYLAPGVALLYGAWLLDEPVTWVAVAGLGLILGGVALASSPRRAAQSAGVAAEA
jgi:drug/metabolite transporter (DMT)-like permease